MATEFRVKDVTVQEVIDYKNSHIGKRTLALDLRDARRSLADYRREVLEEVAVKADANARDYRQRGEAMVEFGDSRRALSLRADAAMWDAFAAEIRAMGEKA